MLFSFMHILHPHHPLSKHVKKPTNKTVKRLTAFDRLVVVVSFVYPLSAIPQAIDVLAGNVEGVSFWSWFGFLFCASVLLIYGIRRNVFPMIISNSIWVIMDALVIAGLLIYSL